MEQNPAMMLPFTRSAKLRLWFKPLIFLPPVVNDPYEFGAIAAANALSDIYAMGAQPIFALNIVGFPEESLPMEVLEQILLGAQDKTHEAGIPILGGHSVEDPEPKFGLVVSGLVDPNKVIKNQGARAGDVLVLTKPLGTGIITNSHKTWARRGRPRKASCFHHEHVK
ncbi:MAG: selenide, water dikinase SelD [Flavobacteriaceae bacterium]|nr:selenide, water dikinase SelD [Flavobacteriaceae bacterium]